MQVAPFKKVDQMKFRSNDRLITAELALYGAFFV